MQAAGASVGHRKAPRGPLWKYKKTIQAPSEHFARPRGANLKHDGGRGQSNGQMIQRMICAKTESVNESPGQQQKKDSKLLLVRTRKLKRSHRPPHTTHSC